MGVRRLARQRALQVLYALECGGETDYDKVEAEFLSVDAKRRRGWSEFASRLARAAHAERRDLDREIAPALAKWKLQRLLLTDRLCLRMGLCELKRFPEIPMRSTIDEYVELARLFGTDESPKFVNGVLDRLSKAYPGKDFGAGDPRARSGPRPSPRPAASPPPEGDSGVLDYEALDEFDLDEEAETEAELAADLEAARAAFLATVPDAVAVDATAEEERP